mgnify:CR=1 FL=1
MANNFQPPPWLQIEGSAYKKSLNCIAVAITKMDKKSGGTYQMKEAMDAIDSAFHRCCGTDPYDGMPLDGELLATYDNAARQVGGVAYKREFSRLPTVLHINADPVAEFEIVSWQTNDAKGDMTPEEFIGYCHAVVAKASR